MFTNNKIARAVKFACAVGAASAFSFSGSALAQESGAKREGLEKIQVTGSRIKRQELVSANPVQVITAEDIRQTGIDNIGDLLQEIPAVAGAATNTAINNGGSGAVRISLRGLGSQYTLVLINGRRVVGSGNGANNSVDLGNIPTAVIKRVEVLKDGASAVYGSDAIGGVVNIITRDDFEGAEFNISSDQSTHSGDGATRTIDFTVGTSSDKGSVMLSGFYARQEEQWSGDRDWSRFDLGMDLETGELIPGGSSAPPWTTLNDVPSLIDGEECSSVTHGAANGPGQSDPTQFLNPTGYVCRDGGRDAYNFAPANYHLTPNERYGIFATANYEVSDSVRFFAELSYTNRSATTLLAPIPLAPLAFFTQSAPYSANNYWNQTLGPRDVDGNTVEIADWRRRVVETGGRNTIFDLNNARAVLGFDGELFNTGWDFEVSYIYGRNQASLQRQGGVNFDKVRQAVGPSFLDETTGEVLCGTPGNVIAGCTSLNIFGIPGTDTQITEEMLSFISFEAHDIGVNQQQLVTASIFGTAFEMPAGPVDVAIGIEHREEYGADFPDALIALGVTSGSSRTATEGKYSVDEVFIETILPLLSEAPGAKTLDLELALRYSDYDTFGDTSNYKLGLKWSPIEDLMIRGTLSTAFRAPSTSDLFAGNSDNSPEVADPCATNPTQFCIADGVPPTGFEPIGDQLSSTRGGNVNLTAEEADSFTLGIVFSPTAIENLEFTLDYWDIELTNAISTIGEQVILNNCARSGIDCDKITRFGADAGSLFGNSSDIDDRNTNVGGIDSSGFDFNARYTMDTEFGEFRTNIDATYYDTYDKTLATGEVVPHAGRFIRNGGDGNFPEWKTNLTLGLYNDDWTASYTLRYIGSVAEIIDNVDVREEVTLFSSLRAVPVLDDNGAIASYDVERDIDSQVIHDIRFTYFYENYSVALGMDNIFDEDPPYADTGFNDNTDPRTYNTVGRHWSVTLSASF